MWSSPAHPRPPLGKKLKLDYEKLHRIGEPIMPLALFDINYADMPKLSIASEVLGEEAVVVKFRLSELSGKAL